MEMAPESVTTVGFEVHRSVPQHCQRPDGGAEMAVSVCARVAEGRSPLMGTMGYEPSSGGFSKSNYEKAD